MKYAINKWIMKIHIVPEEYKSQHTKLNLIPSIKKSKVKYIFLYEYFKSQEEYALEGIVIE
jgi:hypothetical protein